MQDCLHLPYFSAERKPGSRKRYDYYDDDCYEYYSHGLHILTRQQEDLGASVDDSPIEDRLYQDRNGILVDTMDLSLGFRIDRVIRVYRVLGFRVQGLGFRDRD